MMTVQEVSRRAGISVRALRYYDEIGLLPPSAVTEAGYRLYDMETLTKLQQILFFRELKFPLKDICTILHDPRYDADEALRGQRRLLMLRRDRLDGLIDAIDGILKGDSPMKFEPFDETKLKEEQDKLAAEAKARWGHTDEYAQFRKKTAGRTAARQQEADEQAEAIFAAFAAHRAQEPASEEVQQPVRDWQAHITRWYYPCSDEMLQNLGQMYVADPRFTAHIDAHGAGTAQFMADAIAATQCRHSGTGS
ncbi:MAG: MerR family transcriptional regulator [Oscillospiraceae bacterium]|nr:MerR family transcriptional regulator [Oscillospiraceae bacterium]